MPNQNKSVEEVVEDFRHTFKGCDQCNLGNGQGDWIENFIRTVIQQERQTSQEREREILQTICDMCDPNTPYHEDIWHMAYGRLQTLTNPNKD